MARFAAAALLGSLAGCNPLLGIERGEPYPSDKEPELSWVRQIGAAGNDDAADVASTAGRIAVVGGFGETLGFGAGGPVLSQVGTSGRSTYVAAYDDDGALEWAKALPGLPYPSPQCVTAAQDGFFVAAAFAGTVTFGPGEPGQRTLTAAGNGEAFLARYDAHGVLQWVRALGGPSQPYDVVSADGAALLTGAFVTLEGPEGTLTSAGATDAFLTVFDADGNMTLARRFGGPGVDIGTGVAVADQVYVAGMFRGISTFDSNSASLSSAGLDDVFIAAYEWDGEFSWARRLGGSAIDWARGLRTRPGQVLLAGEYQSPDFTFGEAAQPVSALEAAQESDVFLASFAVDGALQWARNAGGPGFDDGVISVALSTSLTEGALISGRFSSTATFGEGQSGETRLTSLGAGDIFFARYDSAGTLRWAQSAGGEGDDWGRDISLLSSGGFVVVGATSSKDCVFGSGQPGQTTLTSQAVDAFVARYRM